MSNRPSTLSESTISVNKIGGSSMGNLKEVLSLVQSLLEKGESPFLVVSAFKRKGFTGGTNALLGGMDQLHEKAFGSEEIDQAFVDLKTLHGDVIQTFFEGEYAAQANEFFQQEYEKVRQALLDFKGGNKVIDLMPSKLTNRLRDSIVGLGERLAGKFLEIYLEQKGIDARFIDEVGCDPEQFKGHDIDFKVFAPQIRSAIQTLLQEGNVPPELAQKYAESVHLNGSGETIDQEDLHEAMFNAVCQSLEAQESLANDVRNQVVHIIGGHIENVGPNGIGVDIGRSYTDLTAVIVARAIKKVLGVEAATYFIKDVYGIHPFNPSLFEDKDGLDYHSRVSLEEAGQIADSGNPALHPDVAKYAQRHGIPVHMRNIMDPSKEGTTFSNTKEITQHPFKSVVSNPNIEFITVNSAQMSGQKGFLEAVARECAEYGISILATGDTRSSITLAMERPTDHAALVDYMKRRHQLIQSLESLRVGHKNYDMEVSTDQGPMASLSIVGHELEKLESPMEILNTLEQADVSIRMISFEKGAVCMTIIVDQKDEKKANEALREYYRNYNQPKRSA